MKDVNVLILEDSPERVKSFRRRLIGNNVVCVETATDCIVELAKGNIDVLFLDHDLGGEVYVPSGPGTGYEVALWLEAAVDKQPKQIIIHSLNNVGAKRMQAALPKAVLMPGAWAQV